jgi:hypothetical protein
LLLLLQQIQRRNPWFFDISMRFQRSWPRRTEDRKLLLLLLLKTNLLLLLLLLLLLILLLLLLQLNQRRNPWFFDINMRFQRS